MKNNKKILILIFLFFGTTEFLKAQESDLIRVPLPKAVKPISVRTITKTKTVIRKEYFPKYITKETKQSGLALTTVSDAKINISSILPKNGLKKEFSLPDGKLTVELPAGKYKLTISLIGYEPEESEVLIQREKFTTVHVPLKLVTYNFSIRTNVNEGEVRFAPVKKTKTFDGQETEKEFGYCIVPILDGKAVIKDLKQGIYNLDIRAPQFPEYETAFRSIEIPDAIPENDAGEYDENASFEINLTNKLSTQTFNQLSPNDWNLPENWQFESGRIKGNGTGTAFPKAQSFRFYKDFEMRSVVRLLNRSSIGFAVRALDKNNFYLIKLTGDSENDSEKYQISALLVKDGKYSDRVLAGTIKPFLQEEILKAKYFTIIIKGRGNLFRITVKDSSGKEHQLGNAEFKDNEFSIGATGIVGTEKSGIFEIGDFTVCNEICK